MVDEQFRTLAYVSLRDDAVRARVVATLDAAGWTVIEQPTGYHVLCSMAEVIEGAQTWRRPALRPGAPLEALPPRADLFWRCYLDLAAAAPLFA